MCEIEQDPTFLTAGGATADADWRGSNMQLQTEIEFLRQHMPVTTKTTIPLRMPHAADQSAAVHVDWPAYIDADSSTHMSTYAGSML